MKSEFIFIISDEQAPAQHVDRLAFYKALIRKYGKPSWVVHVGDEVDQEALNEYGKNPDLPGDGDELALAQRALQPLFSLFSRVDLLESNHVLRAKRKAARVGLSEKRLRPWGSVIGAPKGWTWHKSLILPTKGGQVFFCHGKSKNGLKLVKEMGMSVVQGHYHTEFGIQYTSNPKSLNFSLQVGCMINTKHPAFAYDAENVARPIIGCAGIINGFPKLFPMLLDKRGRWVGVVP